MKNSIWAALLVCFTLQGCALTNPLDFFSDDKPKIETNVQLGKTNNHEQNKLKLENGNTTNNQEAKDGGVIKNGGQEVQSGGKLENGKQEAQDGGVIKNITQNIPIEYLIIMVIMAGFAIPSYKEVGVGTKMLVVETYTGLKILTTDLLGGIIVTPIKGVGNFILRLFDRPPL